MPRLLGFTQSAYCPASRFRLIQFIPSLHAAGWEVDHRPNRPDRRWESPLEARLARGLHYRAGRAAMKVNRWRDVREAGGYDAVFVNRDLAGPELYLGKALLRRNPRVVFDFDDAIHVGSRAEPLTRWFCRNSAWVVPGNDYLAEYAARHNERVTVVPTVIDTDAYEPREWNGEGDGSRVRVGWSGADTSIRATLFHFLPVLARAQRRHPFELVVITNTRPDLPVAGDFRWSFVPWRPELEGRMGRLFDIGIMPLLDTEFQRGKCGLKLLQYMAAGLPNVSSPIGVNRDIVVHGRTGWLAEGEAEWIEALGALVGSAALRRSMGEASRKRCRESYSIERWFPVLNGVLEHVAGKGRAAA